MRSKIDALVDLGEKVTGKPIQVTDKDLMLYNEDITEVLDEITKNYEGGSGGTSDYTELENKPTINGVTVSGALTSTDLQIPPSQPEYTLIGEATWVSGSPVTISDEENLAQLNGFLASLNNGDRPILSIGLTSNQRFLVYQSMADHHESSLIFVGFGYLGAAGYRFIDVYISLSAISGEWELTLTPFGSDSQ